MQRLNKYIVTWGIFKYTVFDNNQYDAVDAVIRLLIERGYEGAMATMYEKRLINN